jgi:hypothetical protein
VFATGIWQTPATFPVCRDNVMTDFVDFVALLAAMDMRSLQAIIATIDQMPGIMPALQAWIEHAARWEHDRRNGFHYPLQGPMAAIAPEEVPAALAASSMISHCFRHERRRDVRPVLAFFEGLTKALAAEHERAGSAMH